MKLDIDEKGVVGRGERIGQIGRVDLDVNSELARNLPPDELHLADEENNVRDEGE